MPHLDKIVEYLNGKLKETTLNRKDIQRGIFYGLAKQVTEERGDQQTLHPVIYTLSGKELSPFLDSKYPFQIYHRILSTTYSPADIQSGDGFTYLQETTTVRAVVYSNTAAIPLPENDLAFLLVGGIFMNIPIIDIGNLPLQNITVQPTGCDFNSRAIFAAEYGPGLDYKIKPQDNYFAFTYQVKMDANKYCLNCVDC